MKNFESFFNLLIGNLIVLLLIAAMATLMVMFKNLSSTVQNMTRVMIQDRLDLTERELSNIFEPIHQELATIREQGRKGLFKDFDDQRQLNEIFIPLLKNAPSVSSLMIANTTGDEYMLLKNDSSWTTRITIKGSKEENPINYHWDENPFGEDELIGKNRQTEKYDPRMRPWFKLAVNSDDNSSFNWTSPYTFFTTKQPGITASARWKDNSGGEEYVIGFDVLIADLSEFTTTIDITEHGKVFILSQDYEVIGLPKDDKFNDYSSRAKYTLKKLPELGVPLLNVAVDQFRNRQNEERNYSFDFENERWWVGFEEYALSQNNKLIIGVIVPETDFSSQIEETRHLLVGGMIMIALFFLIIFYSFMQMKKANRIIAIEKDKNEKLLLNTLPIKVVNDLKENGKSDPQKFRDVSVCFSDIVGFTRASSKLEPKKLINELNDIYTAFDEIMVKYDCERIKTIGDAYLAVCGMPQKNDRHAEMMLRASLEIIEYIKERNIRSQLKWQMRIGIHSGNVVGGIVGVKKYIYDVFGDTINTASRMESNSEPMRVNISEETYRLIRETAFVKEHNIAFLKREPAYVKGKGNMNMFFVVPGPSAYRPNESGRISDVQN
ncbi:MAG: hypothetical protein MI975_04960 [Cytophagales bacterium]|nr:hypothetical protein [Cytophagales bacterium]